MIIIVKNCAVKFCTHSVSEHLQLLNTIWMTQGKDSFKYLFFMEFINDILYNLYNDHLLIFIWFNTDTLRFYLRISANQIE